MGYDDDLLPSGVVPTNKPDVPVWLQETQPIVDNTHRILTELLPDQESEKIETILSALKDADSAVVDFIDTEPPSRDSVSGQLNRSLVGTLLLNHGIIDDKSWLKIQKDTGAQLRAIHERTEIEKQDNQPTTPSAWRADTLPMTQVIFANELSLEQGEEGGTTIVFSSLQDERIREYLGSMKVNVNAIEGQLSIFLLASDKLDKRIITAEQFDQIKDEILNNFKLIARFDQEDTQTVHTKE